MENYGEIGVLDYLRLMRAFLSGQISVDQYREAIFKLNERRVHIPDESANMIILKAYGDADDYDAEVRLPYTILEPELKDRVTKSLNALIELGY